MKIEILLRCNLLSGFPLVVVCLWAVFTQSKVLEERQKLLQSPNYTQVLPTAFFITQKSQASWGNFVILMILLKVFKENLSNPINFLVILKRIFHFPSPLLGFTSLSLHGDDGPRVDLHRACVPSAGRQRVLPGLHLLRGGGQAQVCRAERDDGPPELAGGQGLAGDHPSAGHHLPHHHPPAPLTRLRRLPGLCSLPRHPAVHPGLHRDPPILLPQHRGEGNTTAPLETLEEHEV